MNKDKLNQFNRPVGKLGNWVYYFVGETYTRRAYVKPVQPETIDQKKWWQQFRKNVNFWQSLNPDQKALYEKKATDFKMSGFNYFMHERLWSFYH